MTLSDLERLAREAESMEAFDPELDRDFGAAFRPEVCLALLRVVRAAVAWREQHEKRWKQTQRRAADPLYVHMPDDVAALSDAVDALAALNLKDET